MGEMRGKTAGKTKRQTDTDQGLVTQGGSNKAQVKTIRVGPATTKKGKQQAKTSKLLLKAQKKTNNGT